MKRFALLPLAALLALAGCQDQKQADQLQAEAELTGPSLSASVSSELAGRSVVCVAYDNGLAKLQTKLTQDPSNEDLQEQVEQHQNFINTQCN